MQQSIHRQLVSVNIGTAQPMENAKSGTTGIYKIPAAGETTVTAAGLAGDTICDTKNHGGPDQALYLYGVPDYDWWAERLQQPLAPGTFGENLTISELESATLAIGDRFRIGSVLLEVTAPRIPCVTLARRMNDTSFVRQFMDAERLGVYCRVLEEGTVRAGDAVSYEPYPGERVGVIEVMRDFFASSRTEQALRRFLSVPIAIRGRAYLQQQLDDMLAQKA